MASSNKHKLLKKYLNVIPSDSKQNCTQILKDKFKKESIIDAGEIILAPKEQHQPFWQSEVLIDFKSYGNKK